ncbi:hypothetical protein TcasGA2_TC003511 [Tribolium castaneum]|uniref:Uncharacterized protein n=1 Tax=Tribolium castaneum TaxID=7070 RepID=D6WHB7_TRICA|nr:hypothetical protein TcasGA2_TC003511 [Tribolium castaneum]
MHDVTSASFGCCAADPTSNRNKSPPFPMNLLSGRRKLGTAAWFNKACSSATPRQSTPLHVNGVTPTALGRCQLFGQQSTALTCLPKHSCRLAHDGCSDYVAVLSTYYCTPSDGKNTIFHKTAIGDDTNKRQTPAKSRLKARLHKINYSIRGNG